MQRIAWRAMKLAEHVAMMIAPRKRRCADGIITPYAGRAAYLKVLEYAELEERLSALEAAVEHRSNGSHVLQLTPPFMPRIRHRMSNLDKHLQTPQGGPHVFVGYTEGPSMPGR